MPEASIVIVTRDRKHTAEHAVESAVAQEGDVEVILFDDASTDGTAEYIARKYPRVRVERSERHAGYIVHRNRAARLARGRVILSIDDDAVFTEPTIVRDTLRSFANPRVGAVAIPFVNNFDGVDEPMFAAPPDRQRLWVRDTFIGTAYALRRDLFLSLGGFEERLFHWAEEAEYSQRMLSAGYVVAAGTSALIRHFPAKVTGKYPRKVTRYVHRNRILVPWLNVPLSRAVPMIAARTVQSVVDGLRRPHVMPAALEGVAMGYAALSRTWSARRPMSGQVFRLWRDLWRKKLTPFEDVEARLPLTKPITPSDNLAQFPATIKRA
jgi:GT2 family glycosyltransferase